MSKKKKKKLIKRVFALFGMLFFGFYFVTSCQTSLQHKAESLDMTFWKTFDSKESIYFYDAEGMIITDDSIVQFTFEQSGGYAKVYVTEEAIIKTLEFNYMTEERLFCLTQNVMYYAI